MQSLILFELHEYKTFKEYNHYQFLNGKNTKHPMNTRDVGLREMKFAYIPDVAGWILDFEFSFRIPDFSVFLYCGVS